MPQASPPQVREPGRANGLKRRARALRAFIRRHRLAVFAAGVLVVAVLGAGILWWLHARQYESTDDAFIAARVVPISAEVSGEVVGVPVTDNQLVSAGTVLVRIDRRDYTVALALARAQLDQANADIASLDAQIDAQQAKSAAAKRKVKVAQAALQFAQQQNKRAQALVGQGAGTVQNAQQTKSTLSQSQASYEAAEANETAAIKQIAVLEAQKQVGQGKAEAARADVRRADVNLARTTIVAPIAGRATKISAARGAYAEPGQALMMFVPEHVWVTANFKETQLVDMHPGQPVSIEIDAYPNRVFHGHVASIQAGSGAAFSLLPPENATGNFVKVVQRVPVKIDFNEPPDVYLGPGMSAVPSVKVR